MGALNKSDIESVTEIVKRGTVPLDAKKFHEFANDDSYYVLDTRVKETF